MQDMGFQRVQFSKLFPGEHAPGPPYIIRVIGADSSIVSPVTWCLMCSYKKTPHLDQTNDDTVSGWSKSLNAEESIQKETKLPLRESVSQWEIKSLREQWIWKKFLVGIFNHWGKKGRNHEYQDSNDSASSPAISNITGTCSSCLTYFIHAPFLWRKRFPGWSAYPSYPGRVNFWFISLQKVANRLHEKQNVDSAMQW